MVLVSLPSLLLFSYIEDGYRIGGEEILVRSMSMSVSRHGGLMQIGRDTSPVGGGSRARRERERERKRKGRKRDTHTGGTTHDGPVICWTLHGHVVFHGHAVHSIVHFLALSRGVSYRQQAVQLYDRSRLRATRIDRLVKSRRLWLQSGRWSTIEGANRYSRPKECQKIHLRFLRPF